MEYNKIGNPIPQNIIQKLHGKKIKIKTGRNIAEGIAFVTNKKLYIFHNNPKLMGGVPSMAELRHEEKDLQLYRKIAKTYRISWCILLDTDFPGLGSYDTLITQNEEIKTTEITNEIMTE